MDIDTRFRPGAVFQANTKSSIKDGAPVYMYLFSWQSPVMNGKYKALHCMEIAFAFDTIERTKNMTGGTKEAQVLAEKVNPAWINFARHGNPNHDGLPKWEAYNAKEGTTMFFDKECYIRYHHDQDLMELMKMVQN